MNFEATRPRCRDPGHEHRIRVPHSGRGPLPERERPSYVPRLCGSISRTSRWAGVRAGSRRDRTATGRCRDRDRDRDDDATRRGRDRGRASRSAWRTGYRRKRVPRPRRRGRPRSRRRRRRGRSAGGARNSWRRATDYLSRNTGRRAGPVVIHGTTRCCVRQAFGLAIGCELPPPAQLSDAPAPTALLRSRRRPQRDDSAAADPTRGCSR